MYLCVCIPKFYLGTSVHNTLQLIAKESEPNIYWVNSPYNQLSALGKRDFNGIILSGSPFLYSQDDALPLSGKKYWKNTSYLCSVCYGAQYLRARFWRKSRTLLQTRNTEEIFLYKLNLNYCNPYHLNHKSMDESRRFQVLELPPHFELLANTDTIPLQLLNLRAKKYMLSNFIPKVTHSTDGKHYFKILLLQFPGCRQDWTPFLYRRNNLRNKRAKLETTM